MYIDATFHKPKVVYLSAEYCSVVLCADYQKFPKRREPHLYWLLHHQLSEHQRPKQHPKENIACDHHA